MNITSQQGFTLIELIVVIVILAILSAISLPSFQRTIISNRMTTEINTLVTDLHFAKTEAIKRSKNITICAANDDASKSIEMITNYLTTAIVEGLNERKKDRDMNKDAEAEKEMTYNVASIVNPGHEAQLVLPLSGELKSLPSSKSSPVFVYPGEYTYNIIEGKNVNKFTVFLEPGSVKFLEDK